MTIPANAEIVIEGDVHFDHFKGRATNTANEFIFRNAIGNFDAPSQEGQRIMAERHGHLKWLTAGGVFVALHAAVLPWRNVESHLVLIMNHDSVGAVVHPALVRVAGYIDASSTDVATTILIVPERRWKLKHIDVAVFVNIIE